MRMLTATTEGGYPSVCVGNQATAGSTRRAYVRYDLPSMPEGAVLTRVRLTLVQERVRSQGIGAPKAATLEMRRVTSSWTEGSAATFTAACGGGGADVGGITWAGAPGNNASVSGSELLPTANAVSVTLDTDVGSDDDELIADLQAWYADPGSNQGWQWRVAEELDTDNARLLTPGSLTLTWTDTERIFADGFEEPLVAVKSWLKSTLKK